MNNIIIFNRGYNKLQLTAYVQLLTELLEGKKELGKGGLCYYLFEHHDNNQRGWIGNDAHDLILGIMTASGNNRIFLPCLGELTSERKVLAQVVIETINKAIQENN